MEIAAIAIVIAGIIWYLFKPKVSCTTQLVDDNVVMYSFVKKKVETTVIATRVGNKIFIEGPKGILTLNYCPDWRRKAKEAYLKQL